MARRADVADAAVWAALGLAILVASLRMDRLENLGINHWSIPGLTPAVVGALMIAIAAAIGWRARAANGPDGGGGDRDGDGGRDGDGDSSAGLGPAVLAALLCIGFAGISLGHGLPFALEAAAFVFVFTVCFRFAEWRARGRLAAGLAATLAIAVVAATAIAWLFESVFLVRLP